MTLDDLEELLAERFGPARHTRGDRGEVVQVHDAAGLRLHELGPASVDLAAALGPAPRGEALRPLLEAGCGGAGTGAAAFALDGDGLVLVARLELAAMDADGARAAVGSLLAHAAFWRDEGLAPAPTPADPAPDALLIRL